MNVGVYIAVKDEEYLIAPCLMAVKEVFPDPVVLDFGSTDSTIRIAEGLGVRVVPYGTIDPSTYSTIKNSHGEGHDWIFWLDGDEIYPKESLLNIKGIMETTKFSTINISWRILRQYGGVKQASNLVINGGKAFKPKEMSYYRGWPREVLMGPGVKEPKEPFNGVWCWHGVMLKRSSTKEQTARRKKRKSKILTYEQYEWETLERSPFNVNSSVWDYDYKEVT
jgi:glycosyltransferase involved in cell wall biosynthesis